MTELPEVELFRRDLEREVVGKKVKTVELASLKSVDGFRTKKDFVAQLVDAKITSVSRRGLHLVLRLDNDLLLTVQLAGRSRLRRNANKDDAEKGTEISIVFTQHGQLRLIDPEGESVVKVMPVDSFADELPELEELGFDAIDEPISWTHFGRELLSRDDKLKALLMDQTFLVGIGPVYSDEILFEAGLRYDRTPAQLSTQEIRRLYRAIVEIIHDAVKYRGTSLEENGYVDLFGEPGTFEEHLAVYGKSGQMSPRARGEIARVKFAGKWTYFCEQTQV